MHAQIGHLVSYLFGYVSKVRADRLVAMLLLLQVHGRLTAAQLAQRLETSERTARRDLESLCMAGVPLYSQRGRGGGWSLLGGHRLDLTGLTSQEAQALFLAMGLGSASELGRDWGQGLTAARRKVLAALPEPMRAQIEWAGSAVLIDHSHWGRSETVNEVPPSHDAHLDMLRSAVLGGVQVVIGYEPPKRPPGDRRVHPHGLVCKRGVWYLVATAPSGLRTYRVSRVRSVRVTEDAALRPDGFDLARVWEGVQRRLLAQIPDGVVVHAGLGSDSLRLLRAALGPWWEVDETGPLDDGRTQVTIRFPNAAVAARELASLTDHVEILSPPLVRSELAGLGKRLASRYGD